MGVISQLWSCLVGPRLYRIYGRMSDQIETEVYSPNALEKLGNKIIQWMYVVYNVGLYTAPIIVLSMYRWETFSHQSALKVGTSLGMLLVVALVFRGVGRKLNPAYTNFLDVLETFDKTAKQTQKSVEILRKYEFDFSAWPSSFEWNDVQADDNKPRLYVDRELSRKELGIFSRALRLPCEIIAYFMVHLIGRPMVYPGSVQLLQFVVGDFVLNGRESWVCTNAGKRNKIVTRDGNDIDTMFVDRRGGGQYPNGKNLVVCCEGNAGFYEIGIAATPIQAGYSVLGWNHPGFAGSTGAPFPNQERNAVDAVMQFAIHGLGFKEEDIIIYGWSIGGYTSAWAAMNYPQIGGLILDATFDDVLPLALMRMPEFLSPVVNVAITRYLNLNPGHMLAKYPGPVTIIRRTRDEIITTDENQLVCNRASNLMLMLMESRYPQLITTQSTEVLGNWMAEDPAFQVSIQSEWNVDSDLCSSLLASYTTQHGESYPMTIGEDMTDDEKTRLMLYLASKYLVDFNSTHNNPLDPHLFRKPWRPLTDSYVQVD